MPNRPTVVDKSKSLAKKSATNAGDAKGSTGSGNRISSVRSGLARLLSNKETSAENASRTPPLKSPVMSQSSSEVRPEVPPKDGRFLRQAQPAQSKANSLEPFSRNDFRCGRLLGPVRRPVVSTAQLEIPPIPEVSTRPNSNASSNGSRESGESRESIVIHLDTR